MNNFIKYLLQKTLGFERYLYFYSKYKIKSLSKNEDKPEFFHFMKLLKDGEGEILDIGANIGTLTYYLAKKFPKCQIHSVEPVPINFAVLKKIIDVHTFKNVQLHPFAIGQKTGTLKMILPYNGKTKMQSLSHVKHESITSWNEGEEFDVSVKTIDDMFKDDKVQGILINIENYEFFAFKGSLDLLKKQKPVIYAELYDNDNRQKCFELLSEYGYRAFVVANNQLVEFDSQKHTKAYFVFK